MSDKKSDVKNEKIEQKIYPEFYPYKLPFNPEIGMDVFKDIAAAPQIDDVDDEFKKLNCYNGEIKIMNRGVEFPYTQDHIDEVEKCYDDIIYFIVNYCKVITMGDGLQLLKLYQYQKNAIKVIHENRFSIFKFARQMGKSLNYNTFLPTPNGFKTMGEIQTGEYVYGDDGKPTKVIYKTEAIYEKCYKITFDNGEEIIAGANHDWKFFDPSISDYVIDTTEKLKNIFDCGYVNVHINHTARLHFDDREIKKDPFVYVVNDIDYKSTSIDPDYIFNSESIRIELLNALLYKFEVDQNSFNILNMNDSLTKDIRFLISSLGMKSTVSDDVITFDYSFHDVEKNNRLYIQSIEEVPTEASYCISVDNESHLFLCGESLIPTHNCTVSKTEITVRVNGQEMDLTIGQLYDLIESENIVESYTPNYDYQILTEDGFKDFDGITTRSVDEIYEIELSNETKIRATGKHEIKLFSTEFIKISDLKIGDIVGVDDQNSVTNITVHSGDFRVADMISVKDTHSFAVNDLSAILSNCIDGDSMVTLLDNETGKVFQIHISKLFDYLYVGAKNATD